MRKVIVFEWMSLDGVVQAPAYADEDTSGGFKHGGWHLRYFEERSMKWVVDNVNRDGYRDAVIYLSIDSFPSRGTFRPCHV